jgi:hypothetical protein
MQWDPVTENFIMSWKALKDRKDDEAPEVPKISMTLCLLSSGPKLSPASYTGRLESE